MCRRPLRRSRRWLPDVDEQSPDNLACHDHGGESEQDVWKAASVECGTAFAGRLAGRRRQAPRAFFVVIPRIRRKIPIAISTVAA